MAESCVTWIGPADGDAQREATRLAKLFPAYCDLISLDKLASSRKAYFPIIVVGHDDDVKNLSVPQLQALRTATSWIVLASCSLAPNAFSGTLADTNFLSPAQQLANAMNIAVTACTRGLTFDEVGQGLAFATVDLAMILIPSDYTAKIKFGTHVTDISIEVKLWKKFSKQDDMANITERIALL